MAHIATGDRGQCRGRWIEDKYRLLCNTGELFLKGDAFPDASAIADAEPGSGMDDPAAANISKAFYFSR